MIDLPSLGFILFVLGAAFMILGMFKMLKSLKNQNSKPRTMKCNGKVILIAPAWIRTNLTFEEQQAYPNSLEGRLEKKKIYQCQKCGALYEEKIEVCEATIIVS